MTDNEIIKALECCSEAELKEDCEKLKCPFFDNESYNCMNVDDENAMYIYSLDLINRQKAEIDDLKQDTIPKLEWALKRANEIGISLERENQELKAEIERLKRPLKKLSEIGYCHNFQLERSDLVKWIYDVCDVIKVAKEMTEGENV